VAFRTDTTGRLSKNDRLWHVWDLPTDTENVCLLGKTGSDRSAVNSTRMTRSRHQWSEAIITNDCCGNVSLPPASIEWSRREAASSAIDMIMRSRSGAPLSFKSAAIGIAVSE
jgi:hypothetical protein